MKTTPPLIGFSAPSGTGKTTLIVSVIQHLSQKLKIAAIKHGHHPSDPDTPGKDTHRFRKAGAETVLFASHEGWFLVQDLHNRPEPTLEEQVQHLLDHDLIIVEGYKNESHPKIVVHRLGDNRISLHDQLSNVIAIVTDDDTLISEFPTFSLEDAKGVADFIQTYLGDTI